MLPDFANARAFADVLAHPQFYGGLRLSLFTGTVSTLLALIFAIAIITGRWGRRAFSAGTFLSFPHLAFAVGLSFLIVPTGLAARIIASLVTGWTAPPQIVTAQDPYGFSLIAALVLKETPFLVWALASVLNRDDLKGLLEAQAAVARSLGHGTLSIWLRVLLPQLLPLIVWPLVAVFVYGTTVVDMALVIGPTQPPTLAAVIWSDLNDGEVQHNARGAAGVLALSAMNLCLFAVAWVLLGLARPLAGVLYSGYPRPANIPRPLSGLATGFWAVIYALVLTSLVFMSVAGHWPFPQLLPKVFTFAAWRQLFFDAAPLVTSLVLAVATSAAGLVACVFWLESQPQRRDRIVLWCCGIALCLPALIIALGQYRLFLMLGITGTAPALFLAHVLPVTAYVFVMLQGPYRAYDERWSAVSASLQASRLRFLGKIKWPMLKAPLLSSTAVGFAVSIAQYVPAQLAAAGRYTTLPIEAVTLASGGNRPLLAAYALVMMALPFIAFTAAGRFGGPRWSNA